MNDMRDLDAFQEHAAALQARIAAAEAAGDEVPQEARLMLASLHELARAVEGLRTAIEADGTDEAVPPQSPTEEES